MSDYNGFARMETESWSDSGRAAKYVELFATAPDQAIPDLVAATDVVGGERALDLCCGQGNVTEFLIGRGCLVTGVDFSPAMLDLARRRVPGAVLVEGDAQDLPFPANDFDVVISNFGICHVPDQPRALAEACRVLREHGRFAMTVWCGPDESPCFETLYAAVKAHGGGEVRAPVGPDFHQFAKRDVATVMLSSAGFSDIRLSLVDCHFDLDSPEGLCEIFERGTVRAANLLAAQPSERLAAIRVAIADNVDKRFRHGARWRIPIPSALISARKG